MAAVGSRASNAVLQGACAGDTCCEAGNYNTGIAVARTTGEVYIANECPTGKVMHLDATGNFIGVVNVGAYPSAVQVCLPRKLLPALQPHRAGPGPIC